MSKVQDVLPAFTQALEESGTYYANTIAAYLIDLRKGIRVLRQALGRDPELRDLTPETLFNALRIEAESGLRRSTLQRRVASWRAFERFLLQKSHIQQPFLPSSAQLKTLWNNTASPEHAACLRSEHLQQLWQTLLAHEGRQAMRDLALIALLTEWGFSSHTLIQLNLSDVDLDARVIRVAYPVRGLEEFPLRGAYEPLRRYVLYGRPEFNPPAHEEALFISQLGRRLSRQSLWQLVQKWGHEAGLPFKITPRLLRHTAVYRMLRLGMPPALIGLALGHTNPISTGILLRRLQRLCQDVPPPELPEVPPLEQEESEAEAA